MNRTVLFNEFERKRPMPGDRVAIRYRGVQAEPSRKGAAPAHLYTVTTGAEQELPGFLTRPAGQLPPPDDEDLPVDTEGLPEPPPLDAEVVAEAEEPLPF